MRISVARKKSGFAVLVALVAVTVLTIMAAAFAYAMKVETRLAANTNDDEKFYWLGRGGVERACWWLALEGNQPFSSTQQYWAGGPGDGPETNGPAAILAGESLDGFPIADGTVSIKMEELEGKININAADGQMLQQVLTSQAADPNAITSVPDCILDWIDPDDNTRPAGAESDYYLGLAPSYYAKNAPMDSTEELLYVKGVTRDMFYGTPPEQRPDHELGFGHRPGEEAHYNFGLKDVFTAFSSGKVNLLTADATVLQCIPGLGDGSGNSPAVQNILTARDDQPPMRDLHQLLNSAGIPPPDQAQVMNYVSAMGNTYAVHVTATIGQLSHAFTAIVYRNGPDVHCVSFYRSDEQPQP
jgi:type II secretory pathway component PulK